MESLLLTACVLMNLVTFVLYGVDKRRARRGKWRIPERTLLTCTWLLGGIGALLGMRTFRHKTLHKVFVFSAWTSSAVTLAVMLYLAARMIMG